MKRLEPLSITRRHFLSGSLALSGALLLPRWSRAADAYALAQSARDAIGNSPLIYVSPLKSDGSESTCHGEVWFASENGVLYVVTDSVRWRARAVKQGLDRARIWVGDFGPWKKSFGEFKNAPTFLAAADFVTSDDRELQNRVLKLYGKKYPDGWDSWGPKFRKGLGDGTRVMLRYRPAGA